jgi:hypothetical protein
MRANATNHRPFCNVSLVPIPRLSYLMSFQEDFQPPVEKKNPQTEYGELERIRKSKCVRKRIDELPQQFRFPIATGDFGI